MPARKPKFAERRTGERRKGKEFLVSSPDKAQHSFTLRGHDLNPNRRSSVDRRSGADRRSGKERRQGKEIVFNERVDFHPPPPGKMGGIPTIHKDRTVMGRVKEGLFMGKERRSGKERRKTQE